MDKLFENKKIEEKYYYFKHESGLCIYLFPKNHTTAYALLGVKYGSIDSSFRLEGEKDFTAVPEGVAHFLEHKLFEGENGANADQRFAETGAYSNAYTAFDKTCYIFSCTDNFEESLEILLDFVTHPYFTEETVQKEQGIIGQEIKMYDDSPGWQVYFQLLSNMYEKHSVRLDIAGTIESIANITPEVLYRCYNAFYNLENMALCISGDVSLEQIKKVADKVLTKSEPHKIERQKYDEPASVKKTLTEKNLVVSKPLFCLGLKDSEVSLFGAELAKKSIELEILLNLMFGQSSEFYTRMYSSGKINNKFYAAAEIEPEFSHLLFGGESERPLEVMEEIIAEFEAKISGGLDREEFERFKRVSYAGAVTLFESTENIANSFVNCLFRGCDILELPQLTASVSFEDATNRLAKIFKKENFIISIINPR